MKWKKKGLLYAPDGKWKWNQLYGILPTPYYLENQNVIRIFFASTDENRYGRISYMDVNADDPSEKIFLNPSPVIDIGEPGTFDDCGCNPSSVLHINNKLYLYYAGYQRHVRAPYSILSGLAISNDHGETFQKFSRTPILERTSDEYFIRSAPTVIADNGEYKMWYVSASHWEVLDTEIFHKKPMPFYVIKQAISDDGIYWQIKDGVAIDYENEDEFGFGRPWVVKDQHLYKMWYSVRRKNKTYRIGYAESINGIDWVRKDDEAGIDISEEGWDSQMICYPAVITVKNKTYLFYNGNNNGETGFGYAELINW